MPTVQRISNTFNNSLRYIRNHLSISNLVDRLSNSLNYNCNNLNASNCRSSRRRHRTRDSSRSYLPSNIRTRRDDEEDFFRQYFGSSRRLFCRSHISGLKEKNVVSAIFSILVIATMATAIVQPKWFSIRGGICSRKYIGLQEFIALSYIHENTVNNIVTDTSTQKPNHYYQIPNNLFPSLIAFKDDKNTRQEFQQSFILSEPAKNTNSMKSKATLTNILKTVPASVHPSVDTLPAKPTPVSKPKTSISSPGLTQSSKLPLKSFLFIGSTNEPKNCITPEIACLQRTIIALCLVVILFNLLQFFLDTIGTKVAWLNLLRRNAIGSICGVFFSIVIIGIAYIVSTLLEKEQKRLMENGSNLTNDSITIEIRFEMSYYLVTFAGILGLIGAAFNLFRNPVQYYSHSSSCSLFRSPLSSTPSQLSSPSYNQNVRDNIGDHYFNDQSFGYTSLTSRSTPTITASVPSIAIPPPPYIP